MPAIDFPVSPYIAWGDAEFGGDGVDGPLRHVEIGRPAGKEIRPDIVFVGPLRFLARESDQEPVNVIACRGTVRREIFTRTFGFVQPEPVTAFG
ncbi:MAG: hypothetical protein WCC28_06520 [Mycobacterium sp.]|uniref:hypothetical protein n=1 Tax=Mycobacterium sp. TaxID=1785 RepID=UPI003C76E9FD